MGKIYNDEMEAIRKKKKTIYKSPLPRKKIKQQQRYRKQMKLQRRKR